MKIFLKIYIKSRAWKIHRKLLFHNGLSSAKRMWIHVSSVYSQKDIFLHGEATAQPQRDENQIKKSFKVKRRQSVYFELKNLTQRRKKKSPAKCIKINCIWTCLVSFKKKKLQRCAEMWNSSALEIFQAQWKRDAKKQKKKNCKSFVHTEKKSWCTSCCGRVVIKRALKDGGWEKKWFFAVCIFLAIDATYWMVQKS